MTSEYKDASRSSHAAKMARMLKDADKHSDADVKAHERNKPHLSKEKVAKIADHEIEVKGTPKKARLDRPGRKKGGRTKGDVNIIIAQKPDQGAMPAGAQAPMMPPPRPPVMPPAAGAGAPMPPPGGMPPAAPGASAGMPPMMPRKRGGKAEHPDIDMHYGAGGGLARLEKAAKYGARK